MSDLETWTMRIYVQRHAFRASKDACLFKTEVCKKKEGAELSLVSMTDMRSIIKNQIMDRLALRIVSDQKKKVFVSFLKKMC